MCAYMCPLLAGGWKRAKAPGVSIFPFEGKGGAMELPGVAKPIGRLVSVPSPLVDSSQRGASKDTCKQNQVTVEHFKPPEEK